MFTPPTSVLSLRSDRSPSLSSQPPTAPAGEQTSLSGWWVLLSTDPPCENLSTLPSAPLLLHSPPRLWSSPLCHPQSPPAKGLPSVRKPFLLHGSLPLVQVLSLFFCLCFFFFLLLYPGTWRVSCLLGGLRSSASVQWVFCRSCSTCRCISDVFVETKVISASYSSAILKLPGFIIDGLWKFLLVSSLIIVHVTWPLRSSQIWRISLPCFFHIWAVTDVLTVCSNATCFVPLWILINSILWNSHLKILKYGTFIIKYRFPPLSKSRVFLWNLP